VRAIGKRKGQDFEAILSTVTLQIIRRQGGSTDQGCRSYRPNRSPLDTVQHLEKYGKKAVLYIRVAQFQLYWC